MDNLSPMNLMFRAMPELSDEDLAPVAMCFKDETISITTEPETASVMLPVEDCYGTTFNLGEVLVTVTTVQYEDQAYEGCIVGNEPEKSIIMAATRAIMANPTAPSYLALNEAIDTIVSHIRERRASHESLVASTRVSFESMNIEPN